MDRLEDLATKASQLTVYDLKTYWNQAKNLALNVSEMEAKVREATNDDAWGASSTLMQEIAQGTHNFQHFNEIMPCIYSRFMEKEAREWRQIYKALTLLEYLVKNGSERVVDDARSHVSTVKMLRSFHYIDPAGKDQGINVRNRAKELAELLGDVDRIRQERRKAKQNRNKYQGVQGGSGGGGMSFQSATGSRYGGFGSDEYSARMGGGGGGGGGGYDSGDVYRGSTSSHTYNDHRGQPTQSGFDEYDAGDDEDDRVASPASAPSRGAGRNGTGAGGSAARSRETRKPEAKKEPPKPVVEDLFSFGDEEEVAPTPAVKPASAASASNLVDDDFDDFQAAPTASTFSSPVASPPPQTARPSTSANLFDMLDSPAATAPPVASSRPFDGAGFMPATTAAPPAYPQTSSFAPSPSAARPNYTSTPSSSSTAAPAKKAASSGGGFDDLWLSSLGGVGATSGSNGAGAGKGKSIQELEREKTMASLWGAPTAAPSGAQVGKPAARPAGGSAFDDLLG